MVIISNMRRRFIIYGLLGWSLETFWTGLGSAFKGDIRLRGFSYLWMFPIYGLAALFEPIHDRIRRWSWIVRGGIWVILIYAIEYFSGWLLRVMTGRCPWDYQGSTRFEVDGLIRLDYAPAWFIAGLLFERIHHWLDRELR